MIYPRCFPFKRVRPLRVSTMITDSDGPLQRPVGTNGHATVVHLCVTRQTVVVNENWSEETTIGALSRGRRPARLAPRKRPLPEGDTDDQLLTASERQSNGHRWRRRLNSLLAFLLLRLVISLTHESVEFGNVGPFALKNA